MVICATPPCFSAASTTEAAQRIGGYLDALGTSNALTGGPGLQPFVAYVATAPDRAGGAGIGDYLSTVSSNSAPQSTQNERNRTASHQ